MTLTVGGLCSGIGGLELGIERALGARTVWQAEVDPHASTVLARHWPGVPNHGDLTIVDWAQVEPVDVMCFGFPCQDISSAGRRAGLEGEKSALWFACADAVRLVRPRHLLVENVGALLVRGFDRVQGDLAEMGYDTRWGCLRSSDIGAPHRRERVFVAAADTERRPGSEPHGHDPVGGRPGHSEQARMGSGVAATDTRRPGTGRDAGAAPGTEERGRRRPSHDRHAPVVGGAAPAHPNGLGCEGPLAGSRRDDSRSRPTATDADRPSRAEGDAEPGDGAAPHFRGGAPGPGGRRSAPADPDDERCEGTGSARRRGLGPAHSSDVAADADSSATDTTEGHHQLDELDTDGRVRWGAYTAAIRRWEAIHGPAPRPRDHKGRLNPELPEWMLGYPASWVTALDLPRTAQLRLLGNSVQPQVAEAAARLLLAPLLREAAA